MGWGCGVRVRVKARASVRARAGVGVTEDDLINVDVVEDPQYDGQVAQAVEQAYSSWKTSFGLQCIYPARPATAPDQAQASSSLCHQL